MFGWFGKETQSAYIARPPEHAFDLIYLHPDKSIPRGTKITVRANECALFFREGQYIGRIDAGTVLLDTANIPFLGHLVIDRFTDGNHFICELFFVSLNETILQIPLVALGQYKDLNSANVVTIAGGLSYTVRVGEPAKLLTRIGGQSSGSGSAVTEIFNGRMLNWLRRSVGSRTQAQPVLNVVSNIASEEISQEIQAGGQSEFVPLGLAVGRVFDLVLTLDAESLELLRQFGVQESSLALQAKGMRLATGEGFAEYNLIQGQRAALEGLGRGLGTGNGPMIISGIGLGANLTGRDARPAGRSTVNHSEAPMLSARTAFVIKSGAAESGPFSARQVALTAISKSQQLSEVQIRSTDDPAETSYSADLEPDIVAEYKRRIPRSSATDATASPSPHSSGNAAFDAAFAAAVKSRTLSNVDLEMLVRLSVMLSLDSSAELARTRVVAAATTIGVKIEES